MKTIQITLPKLSAAFCVLTLVGCAQMQKPPVSTLPEVVTPLPITNIPADGADILGSGKEVPSITQPIKPTVKPHTPTEAEGRVLLNRLLPRKIPDRHGWENNILSAFKHLKIPYTAEYFCAANAVIEQESSWQPDPTVPGLPNMVWGAIEQRAKRYHLPMPLVKAAFLKPSRTGQSYKTRIDNLRTERQVSELFEDMASEAHEIGLPVGMKNPIRTGGPMQVSVEFAEGHTQAWPYPYAHRGVRNEVFSFKGGVYFGVANLLQYPAPYDQMIYRFADYNAGRYASRNAAFQSALGKMAGTHIVLDGDLLNYKRSDLMSNTAKVLLQHKQQLGMSSQEIMRDLQFEKRYQFAATKLYERVFTLADKRSGRVLPKAILPQIDLKSPKIHRKLTTAWFANRVEGRYQRCMAKVN